MARGKPKAPEGCFWRGDTLWAKIVIKGQTYRESLKTDSTSIAREARATWEKGLKGQAYHGVAAALSFESAVADWLPWVEKQLPSKRSFSSYKSALGMLSPWLDGIMVSQLTKKFIGRIARERAKDGITKATLKRNLGAL